MGAQFKTRAYVQRDQSRPIELETVHLAKPEGHNVRVRLEATGICQSQIHAMSSSRSTPLLFGHEGYGVVEEVGMDVSRVSPGDRVIVTWLPAPPSDTCELGKAEAILADGAMASWDNVNTWCEHALVDERYLFRTSSYQYEPALALVGCAVPTGAGAIINAGNIRPGDSVAIIGMGGVGIPAVAAAAWQNARTIVAIDLAEDKLEFARRFGATHTVDASVGDPVQEVLRHLSESNSAEGVDVALDCVGTGQTLQQALSMTRNGDLARERGGRAVLVGMPSEAAEVDTLDLLLGQKSIVGTMGGNCRQEQLELFCDWAFDGVLDPRDMVSTIYAFEDLPTAVADLRAGKVLGRLLVTMSD